MADRLPNRMQGRAGLRRTCAVLAMYAVDEDGVVLSLHKHAQRLLIHEQHSELLWFYLRLTAPQILSISFHNF